MVVRQRGREEYKGASRKEQAIMGVRKDSERQKHTQH